MKTKNLIWWVIALASIDVLIKVIIDAYFLDSRFTIIPGLVEFKPTFNDVAPYFIQLLGHRLDHKPHLILVICVAIIAYFVYKRALKKATHPKFLNAAFCLIFAAIVSSLVAQIIYKGILDYIYFVPFFVFDLKDVYVNCGTILFLIYIYHSEKYRINPDKINIVQAEIQDAPEILELQYQAFQSEATLYNNYNIEPLKQTLASIEADFEDHTFLKAIHNKKIIGSIKLKAENNSCWVGRLIVSPVYQRQGLGRKLLMKAEKNFPGIDTYILFTGSKSTQNIHLYESMGYHKTEEYTDEKNPELILIRMVKSLTP